VQIVQNQELKEEKKICKNEKKEEEVKKKC